MPLVYRVEDSTGDGMYYGPSRAGSWMQEQYGRHPTPRLDSLLMENFPGVDADEPDDCYVHFSKMNFGFGSLEQLNFWIYRDEWKRTLKEDGFFISVYEVPVLYVGNTQAVYPKDSEKKLVDKIEF